MTVISEAEMRVRRLPVAGTFNVRDIGGYQTADGRTIAWGRILRGDAMHRVDDRGRELLAEYPLRTSLDLRESDERDEAPDQLNADVRLVSIPIFTYQTPDGVPVEREQFTSLSDVYRHMVAERGPALVAALRELARPDALPALVHCAAGKDRTGIVVALLLASLGVPDDVIAVDYAATSLFLNDEFLEAASERAVRAGQDRVQFSAMLSCAPELILDVLAEVRASHGQVTDYLLHHGLLPEELEWLRVILLEDGDPCLSEGHPADPDPKEQPDA